MTVEELIPLMEQLADSIGKSVVYWLIKAEMPVHRNVFRELILSEMGFQPVEIVDVLYPNLGKSARRAKAQAISLRLKK